MSIPFADNFLAGSLISLLFPVLLLVALVTWYMIAVKHVGRRGSEQPDVAGAGGNGAGSRAPAGGTDASVGSSLPPGGDAGSEAPTPGPAAGSP
jgi:hypothetical protein